jgi:ubiquinone/menaquinone biosynthesis C-methylase UbiE
MSEAGKPAQNTEVVDLYNRVASCYSAIGPAVFEYFGQRLVDLAELAPGERVLDVGAGRGALLFPAAARVGARGFVTGIEVAETAAHIKDAGLTNATIRLIDEDCIAMQVDE